MTQGIAAPGRDPELVRRFIPLDRREHPVAHVSGQGAGLAPGVLGEAAAAEMHRKQA